MFLVHAREALGVLILKYLAKMTLPKLFANELGNVFVPNGTLTLTLLIVSELQL